MFLTFCCVCTTPSRSRRVSSVRDCCSSTATTGRRAPVSPAVPSPGDIRNEFFRCKTVGMMNFSPPSLEHARDTFETPKYQSGKELVHSVGLYLWSGSITQRMTVGGRSLDDFGASPSSYTPVFRCTEIFLLLVEH